MSILEEMYNGSNQTLNERPYSRTQSAIDSTKGKAKGLVGSGEVEQGAQEVGAQANAYWSQFKRYLGRKYGKSPSTVPYSEVASFFSTIGLDTKFLGNNQKALFNPKSVGTAILQATREQMDDVNVKAPKKEEQPTEEPQQSKPQPQSAPQSTTGGLSGTLSGLSSEQRQQLLNLLG